MMEKKYNVTMLITTIICLTPMVLAIMLYERLPSQIPVHFDYAGSPDNYLPKAAVTFGMPVLFALLNLYTHFRLNKDPKAENASKTLKKISYWVIPAVSVIVIPLSLFTAMGTKLPITTVASLMVGLVIVVCGNYMPKCKQNYTMGIKLPWTLDSEVNWNKTHRFAGFIWTLGGFLILVNSFFTLWYVSLVIVVLLVVSPVVYSYVTYKAMKKEA